MENFVFMGMRTFFWAKSTVPVEAQTQKRLKSPMQSV